MARVNLDVERLYADIEAKLSREDLSWRALGRFAKIGPVSFQRLREGKGVDVSNALTLCEWLGNPVESYALRQAGEAAVDAV